MDTRRGLLSSLYTFLLGIPWQNVPNTTSLEERRSMAFLRVDAYVQRENLDEAEPESYHRVLSAGEKYFQDDSAQEVDPVSALQCIYRNSCLLASWSLTSCILTVFRETGLPTRAVSEASQYDREPEPRSAWRLSHCHSRWQTQPVMREDIDGRGVAVA